MPPTDNEVYYIRYWRPDGKALAAGRIVRINDTEGYVLSTRFGILPIPMERIERISNRYSARCPICMRPTVIDCYLSLSADDANDDGPEDIHECLKCHALFRQKLVKIGPEETEDLKLKDILRDRQFDDLIGHGPYY